MGNYFNFIRYKPELKKTQMDATQVLGANKTFCQKLLNFYQSDTKLIRLLLFVAGIICLSDGYTFYSQQLTNNLGYYQDISIGTFTLVLVCLSFFVSYIKNHLRAIIIITVYGIMMQSI